MVKKKEVGKHMRKIIRIFQKVIKEQLSTVISSKKNSFQGQTTLCCLWDLLVLDREVPAWQGQAQGRREGPVVPDCRIPSLSSPTQLASALHL